MRNQNSLDLFTYKRSLYYQNILLFQNSQNYSKLSCQSVKTAYIEANLWPRPPIHACSINNEKGKRRSSQKSNDKDALKTTRCCAE